MNSGMSTTHQKAFAILPGAGTIIVFTEETRGQLYTALQRKAAMAHGIDAMAMRAIDTGDHDQLEWIAAAASELGEALQQLAAIIGQAKTPTTTA